MSEDPSSPIVYSIEVSGWDMAEEFFVDQTQLEWCSGAGEKVSIHRPVRLGSVVFLRLVHPTDLGPAFPVAYLVEGVRKRADAGLWELRLTQLRRRTNIQREIAAATEEELEVQHQ